MMLYNSLVLYSVVTYRLLMSVVICRSLMTMAGSYEFTPGLSVPFVPNPFVSVNNALALYAPSSLFREANSMIHVGTWFRCNSRVSIGVIGGVNIESAIKFPPFTENILCSISQEGMSIRNGSFMSTGGTIHSNTNSAVGVPIGSYVIGSSNVAVDNEYGICRQLVMWLEVRMCTSSWCTYGIVLDNLLYHPSDLVSKNGLNGPAYNGSTTVNVAVFEGAPDVAIWYWTQARSIAVSRLSSFLCTPGRGAPASSTLSPWLEYAPSPLIGGAPLVVKYVCRSRLLANILPIILLQYLGSWYTIPYPFILILMFLVEFAISINSFICITSWLNVR